MTTKTLMLIVAIVPAAAVIASATVYLSADSSTHPLSILETGTSRAALFHSEAGNSPLRTDLALSGSTRSNGNGVKEGFWSTRSERSVFPVLDFPGKNIANATTDQSEPPAQTPRDVIVDHEVVSRELTSISGATSNPSPVAGAFSAASATRKLPLPLAFQELDPEASGLTPVQSGILSSLRENFVRDIGGPAQNPHDPRYAKRWRELQPLYDGKLRLFFGDIFADKVALLAAHADYEGLGW